MAEAEEILQLKLALLHMEGEVLEWRKRHDIERQANIRRAIAEMTPVPLESLLPEGATIGEALPDDDKTHTIPVD